MAFWFPGLTKVSASQLIDLPLPQIVHVALAPPPQPYPGGETILQTILLPLSYRTFIPWRWTIPGQPVLTQVAPGIRCLWGDGTETLRENTGIAAMEEPGGSFYFGKGGQLIEVQFVVSNGAASSQQQLGPFIFEGWIL